MVKFKDSSAVVITEPQPSFLLADESIYSTNALGGGVERASPTI